MAEPSFERSWSTTNNIVQIVAVLNGEFIKVGSSQVQKTNVRIVVQIQRKHV
jgi:hypothetical protein